MAPSDDVPAPVSMSTSPPSPVVFPTALMLPMLELSLTVTVMFPASSVTDPPDVVMSLDVISKALIVIPPSSDCVPPMASTIVTEPPIPLPPPPAAVIVRARSWASSSSALIVPLTVTSPSLPPAVLRVSIVTSAARMTLASDAPVPFSSTAPVLAALLFALVVRLSFRVMPVEAVISMASPMVGASLPSSTDTLSSTTVDATRIARWSRFSNVNADESKAPSPRSNLTPKS